jgi:hypothetical protein
MHWKFMAEGLSTALLYAVQASMHSMSNCLRTKLKLYIKWFLMLVAGRLDVQ